MATDITTLTAQYDDLRSERAEWEAEWRNISDYLLPGRGIYQTYSKPRKRQLTSSKVINTIAEDSLYVLTSGMHGGLTSPSREWFKLSWADEELNRHPQLKAWLQDCEKRLHKALHASNFYSVINSFYIEYAGFGTGAMYVGEDSLGSPFRFELLTAGEYAFSIGINGLPDIFYRTIFKSPRQLVELFPDTVDKELKNKVKNKEPGIEKIYITLIEAVLPEKYQDKPFTQIIFAIDTKGEKGIYNVKKDNSPLSMAGFYEFPYPLARWNTIGSDIYGIGPGSRALPDIKRLQEMEKAFLMATHKSIDPPLFAPSRLQGKINSLPGGYTYGVGNEEVKELYRANFEYQGVSAAVERVEQRIQRNFFNDIFLTAARDPNASPYKATEVTAREQEKMLRLGPVIERLQHEFLQPVIERCFNIMLRKDLFMLLDPALAQLAGDYKIDLVSPLATAQRAIALQGINSFMAFIGQAAQFDQRALDKVNIDATIDEYADITGVSLKVINSDEQTQTIRQNRMAAMQEEKQKQEAVAGAQVKSAISKEQAEVQKIQADTGATILEGQQIASDIEGMI